MFTTLSRTFLHPFIAVALALAITVSPMSSTSAQAQGHPIRNGDFVAAMIALGLFGLIVTNEAGKRNGGITVTVPRNKRLPDSCLKTYETPNGDRAAFSNSCLRNHFRGYRNLPSTCKGTLRFFDNYGYLRTTKVYRPRCLQNHGYRIYYND